MESDEPGVGLASSYRQLIERIHASKPLLVMEFAGAGAQALHWLHSVAGSSRTILEATDRYSPPSLVGAVGFMPARFTSPEVAAALAQHAAERAQRLALELPTEATGAQAPQRPTFGLGLTATIATDRRKRGEHRCELAVRDCFGSDRYSLTLAKGERDRAGEEALLSILTLRAIADASGVLGAPLPELRAGEELDTRLTPAGAAAEFERDERDWLLLLPDGTLGRELPKSVAVLSGSFNPVHRGHLRLATAASQRLGRAAIFELPLMNADKAGIGLSEARRRAAQFLGLAPVLLTRAPLFSDKARLLPSSTFIVGADTAARLLEQRFYGSEQERERALRELHERGTRFLVAGRRRDGRFLELGDLDVPAWAVQLFESLSESEFREDLSSSQLREEWPQ